MKAITKFLAGGVAIAALATAAPASAQFYPGYGAGAIEQVLAQVLGGGPGYGAPGYGYGGPGYGAPGYGYSPYGANNSQAAVSQCVGAVQQRLNAGYSGYGYNGYGSPYGGYGNARVLGISRVEPRSDGGLTVRGVANSGRSGAYGYGYNGGQPPIDLTFKCKTDYRGMVYDIDVDQAERNYNSGYTPYTSPYANDYSQYGYHRY
jgi:defect-in-organelle-trafficking protein DotC